MTNKAAENSVNSKAIIDGAVKSADVKDNGLTGNYPKPQIAPGAVGSSALAPGTVDASKLGAIVQIDAQILQNGRGDAFALAN